MELFDMRSASYEEIAGFIEKIGEKPYRAEQIFNWLNAKFANSFDEMTNLPINLRKSLGQIAEISLAEVVDKKTSKDGQTIKYLLKLNKTGIMEGGDVYIESVLMRHKWGFSICISSQAGCRMGCDFCASGISGLVRNLTAGEMAAQYSIISRDIGANIGNIVIMGIGEPLDNFDNLLKFLTIINDDKGAAVGFRRIGISTCGIVPRIYELASHNLQLTLAVSLHAPNDQIRRQIMPIARKYGINELLAACRAYEGSGRRVTFEYIMLKGINDSIGCAKELAGLLIGLKCHVNLIPANKIPKKGYTRARPFVVSQFADILTKSGLNVSIRKEMGGDISAACGQLRNEHENLF